MRKRTQELKNKQQAELAAFEAELKVPFVLRTTARAIMAIQLWGTNEPPTSPLLSAMFFSSGERNINTAFLAAVNRRQPKPLVHWRSKI